MRTSALLGQMSGQFLVHNFDRRGFKLMRRAYHNRTSYGGERETDGIYPTPHSAEHPKMRYVCKRDSKQQNHLSPIKYSRMTPRNTPPEVSA